MFNIKNIFKKKSDKAQPEKSIDLLKKEFKKAQQKKIVKQERRQRIRYYIDRAGLNIDPKKLSKTIFNAAVFINLAISGYLIYYFSVTFGITWEAIILSMIVLWVFVFVLLIFVLWMMFYIAVDLKIFKRKVDIEEVLPDFLQLTASNINAGMPVDKALWYAVRPRFGVLAKEIEIVAKETMGGVDLKVALEKFASRYDSTILKRSVSMINEGIEAGGEIGDLLNRIAINIQEQKSILREMSANVTAYVIFITFATIVASPVLFALSGILIGVVHKLGSSVGATSNVASHVGIALRFSGAGITLSDFKIFAIVSLIVTSLFSAMIISTIRKGNIKSGVKYIPLFIIVSITIYLLAQGLADNLLKVFI